MTNQHTTVFLNMPLLGQVLDPQPDVPPSFGGAEVQMSLLLKALCKLEGYRVVVFSNEVFEYPGIEVRVIKPPIKRGVSYISRYINIKNNRALFKYDTAHALFLQTLFDDKLTRIAFELGIPTVFRINGDSLIDGSSINQSSRLARLHKCLPKFDVVVAQSPYQQQLLQDRWGIEAPLVRPAIEHHDLKGDKQYVLWVGRRAHLKRPWLFLELARKFPDVPFRMVTTSVWEKTLGAALEEEARAIPNVEIILDVPHKEMPNHYSNALAFVSTSMTEGAPSVFAEAGVAGTPIFSLDVNPSGVLDDGTLGVCACGNRDVLADELRAYLESDDQNKRERQQAAYQFAKTHWDQKEMLNSYLAVFALALQ